MDGFYPGCCQCQAEQCEKSNSVFTASLRHDSHCNSKDGGVGPEGALLLLIRPPSIETNHNQIEFQLIFTRKDSHSGSVAHWLHSSVSFPLKLNLQYGDSFPGNYGNKSGRGSGVVVCQARLEEEAQTRRKRSKIRT